MKRAPLLALSFAFVLAAAPADARNWTVDLRAPARAPAPTAAEDGGGAEFVRAAEAPEAVAPALAPGDVVTLLLFDGDQVNLVVEESSASTISGSRAFLARTAGSSLMNAVVLVDADGGLHARVQGLGEGRVLRVFPRGGATAVEESEPAPVVEDGEQPAGEPDAAPAAPAPEADGGEPLPAATQSDNIVDVLVTYDLGALAWAENNGGPTNFAETAVQNMNLALANSNLDGYFRFRLVGIEYVDARASGVRAALYAYGTGEWAVVPAARNRFGADVVTMLIDTGLEIGVTGVGWALTYTTEQQGAYFSSAYNACAIRAVAKGETMTHECGHNLGCGHANTPGQSDPGPQSFPYSSGYHFTGNDGKKYHTIMGYDSVDGDSDHYTLANVFSSPDLTFAGKPAGTAASNDNRRVLTQTWAWAANWRDAVLPPTYDVFFSPESGTYVEGSLTVTLSPGKSGLPIRYTLDGSAPTLSSPLYSGPITVTASTTIRAATVYNGVLGPVCTARYPVPDFAEALDTPGLAWTADASYPWSFRTDVSFDGADSAFSDTSLRSYYGDTGLHATISGPKTMSFRWSGTMHNTDTLQHLGTPQEKLAVYIDGNEVWSESALGIPSPWKQSQVEIPEGSHEVAFRFIRLDSVATVSGREYGVWIDTVRFDALSKPPVLSPATTDDESTATAFTGGSQTVSLAAPDGDGTKIYFTTDGTDPLKKGVLYEEPFEIAASTRVRAVAVAPGLDTSVEAAGLYLDRHRPVRPGEWTADADGLRADAAADSSARLILGLFSRAGDNTTCADFRAVAENPTFTAWCAANGVYLLVSDTTVNPDGVPAKPVVIGWMNQLESGTPLYGPTLVAVTPNGATTKAGVFTMSSGKTFGTETYDGTVDSLVACVAAIIGKTPLAAPTATPDAELAEASAFPVSVTLSNPNASGTIRYTLDGSAPTRSSAAYSAPVSVPKGQVLSAAVFPANASDLSSPVLRRNYRTVAGFFGIPEDAFDWSLDQGAVRWRIHPLETKPTLRSGNLGSSASVPYESVVRAVARTAGTLAFQFGDITYYANSSVYTAPDGEQTTFKSSGTAAIEWRPFSVDVQPGDVLLWTRVVNNAGMEFENYDSGWGSAPPVRCGSYLQKLVWTPPAGEPPTLGTVSVAATTTGATVSVPVAALGEGSSSVTVKVVVNGVERTLTLDAAGTATLVFSGLEPGTSYTAAITATGSNGESSTASKTFSTESLPSVGWFDVKWESDGYGTGTMWWNAAAERTSGGRWAVPAGDASSRNGSFLRLALPKGGELRFTALSPSAAGGTVTVDGTVVPVASRTLPDVPSGALAALCFARGGYKAWNGAEWVSLSGAMPSAASTAWVATFDCSQSTPRVRYAVGGTVLKASGSEWIPLATSRSYVSGVGYAGTGSVSDFKAGYAGGGYVPPVLSTAEDGHVPLAFGKDASNNPTFEVTIRNAVKDAWYTVYAADAVNGPYKAVTSVKATADGLKTLSIPAPSSKPARFVRIGVSDAQVPANTEL